MNRSLPYTLHNVLGVPARCVIFSGGCAMRPAMRRTVERKAGEDDRIFWSRVQAHAWSLSAPHGLSPHAGHISCCYRSAAEYLAMHGEDRDYNQRAALTWLCEPLYNADPMLRVEAAAALARACGMLP